MTDLRRGFQALVLAVLASSAAGAARADEPREVWIHLPECAQLPYDAAQLSRSLALELSQYGLQARVAPGAPGGAQLRVWLSSCDPDPDSLSLRWEAPGAPARQREVSLSDVPWTARARTLALLISDALRPARWAERERRGERATTSAPSLGREALAPLPADPLYDSQQLPQRSDPYPLPYPMYWSAALRASWVPRVGMLIHGAGMGVGGLLTGSAEWALEASYAGGRSKVLDDVYDLVWVSAALGLDYNLASARQIQLGPRLWAAYLSGYSATDSASNLGESLALVGARLRISPRLRSESVSLDLLIDAGYPALTLHTDADAEALGWTAWVITVGTGLTIEL